MEKRHVLDCFVNETYSTFNLVFLLFLNYFNSYILSFIPMNCTALKIIIYKFNHLEKKKKTD